MDINPVMILYQMINFLVLLMILTFLFNKFIRPFMKKRNEEINAAYKEIEAGRKQVEQLQKDISWEIEELKRKAAGEVDAAVQEGEQIKRQILEQARKEAAEMINKARTEVEQEKTKMLSSFEREIASLSIALSGRFLKDRLDQESEQDLILRMLSESSKKVKV